MAVQRMRSDSSEGELITLAVVKVRLSSGMLGEEFCSHNIEIGVKRLKEYGLEPVFMPNA